jgi:electron transport complex protein RnfE
MMLKELVKGLFKENPIFIIMLGLCPALAVSTTVGNALGMGAAVIFVLLGSNIFISLLKNLIPGQVRIPAYIVIIATFVTIVDLFMQAFTPELSKSLGVYVPLIVVNCVILGRAEAFANKNTILTSIFDAIGMGIGFTIGLTLIAIIREGIGSGTITLFSLPGMESGKILVPIFADAPVAVFVAPAGALFVIGLLKGLFNALGALRKRLAEDEGQPAIKRGFSLGNLFKRRETTGRKGG